MAIGTGNLPYPGKVYNPFDILTAEELNEDVANIESLADGSGIGDEAVTPEKRSGGFYQIRHTFANATGTQTITGVPFKPKAIIVHGGVQSNVAVIISHGMATDGSPIVQSSSGSASTASSAGTSSATTRTFVRSSTSGTVTFGATVTGFTADGITVNVGTTSAVADDRTYDIMFMG